jgi:FkbM family methyltransferase|tara:strand:- start:560 stop:1282 length:723 start_codon:yes stop_codon:yes gene_type:complete
MNKKSNAVFDIGANDGLDGLGFALLNDNYYVYAFEANPELILKIKENKKKIENFFEIKLNNYEIINKAVSNFNGFADFNISQHDLCSSLLPYKFVATKEKIKTEVITLEKFCIERKIEAIIYIHIDTQGSDLDVLKGLASYRGKIHTGVMETMIHKKDTMYEGGSYYDDVISFFKKWQLDITKTEYNNYLKKEINVYFSNNNYKNKNFRKFKKRFINRIITDKTNFKDFIYKTYLKKFIL